MSLLRETARRPLRVLELRSAWGAGGGPEKTILLSAALHDRARVRPRVAYLRDPRDEGFERGVRARARDAGTRILEVRDRGRLDPRCIARLRLLAARADVVHAHDYKTDVYGLLLGVRPRAKLVATAHGWTGESWKVRTYQTVDTLALRFYDRVIAVSDATRDVLLAGGVDERRVVTIRNAIDERVWHPRNEAGDLRKELGISRGELVVGTVARLSPEKGIDLLVEIAGRVEAALAARGAPRPVFVVAGDGPERTALRDLVERSGLARRFLLLGARSDPLRVANTLDVAVSPSRVENLPNALLEAMAVGKPCVAFAVGGIPELVGRAGELVSPYDTASFAAEICALLANPARRRRLGDEARSRIENGFSFRKRLERVEALYEEVVRDGSPRKEAA